LSNSFTLGILIGIGTQSLNMTNIQATLRHQAPFALNAFLQINMSNDIAEQIIEIKIVFLSKL
jgi:hypothetical protein